jgi:hypothetical protein
MLPLRLVVLLVPLVLTACSTSKMFEGYRVPTGWAHLDRTPISTPHGYHKTAAEEEAVRDVQAVDADAWKNGIAAAIMPISSVLDMNQPVAVVADPPLTPLNASAANYARELLVDMSYLIALPGDTVQTVRVGAARTSTPKDQAVVGANHVALTVSVVRDNIVYASRTVDVMVPRQAAESNFIPDLSFIDGDIPTPTPRKTAPVYNP